MVCPCCACGDGDDDDAAAAAAACAPAACNAGDGDDRGLHASRCVSKYRRLRLSRSLNVYLESSQDRLGDKRKDHLVRLLPEVVLFWQASWASSSPPIVCVVWCSSQPPQSLCASCQS